MWKFIKSLVKKKIIYPDKIQVTLNEDVMSRCSEYKSNTNCALAVALKDKGFNEVIVGGVDAHIGKSNYYIDNYPDISDAYEGKLPQNIRLTKILLWQG